MDLAGVGHLSGHGVKDRAATELKGQQIRRQAAQRLYHKTNGEFDFIIKLTVISQIFLRVKHRLIFRFEFR